MLKVLLVEDDETIAQLLCEVLAPFYHVTHIVKPSLSLELITQTQFAIFILDLTLPEMDGLALCKKLKDELPYDAGIIISSARSGIDDKLIALRDGADDYLPKPYDPRELLARMEVLINRLGICEVKSDFLVNVEEATLFYKDEKIELTWAEYEIFSLLFGSPNQVIPRSSIANSMSAHRYESGADSINVLIARLRKKLPKSSVIITVRGLGYKFSSES
jgi:two-component system, OmpR family, response regulator